MASTDDYTEQTAQMAGNAAGWVGIRLDPGESPRSGVKMRDTPQPRSEDVTLSQLRPFETVTVVLEAGQDRREYRAVANESGRIYLSLPGHYVPDDHDPALSVQVGDGEANIMIHGHDVTKADKYED